MSYGILKILSEKSFHFVQCLQYFRLPNLKSILFIRLKDKKQETRKRFLFLSPYYFVRRLKSKPFSFNVMLQNLELNYRETNLLELHNWKGIIKLYM